MRIDVYTKFVLTVIALCLIWLSVGGPALLPGVSAQTKQPPRTSGYNRVVIAGWLDEAGREHTLPSTFGTGVVTTPVTGMPVAVVFSNK